MAMAGQKIGQFRVAARCGIRGSCEQLCVGSLSSAIPFDAQSLNLIVKIILLTTLVVGDLGYKINSSKHWFILYY